MFLKSSLQVVNNVRTIGQQISEDQMMTTVKKLFVRPSPLLDDLAGVVVLFVLLFVGLTLSGTA